jgi:magnesium transporter
MVVVQGSITTQGSTSPATPAGVAAALAGTDFFWLDLDAAGTGDPEVATLFTETFHFHDVAVSATTAFGQRARIDGYPDFTHIVTFGASDDGTSTSEVHCFVTAHYLISVHQGPCAALASVAGRLATTTLTAAPQITYLYVVLDSLVDSFFPVLSNLDDTIDAVAAAILKNPTEEQLGQIFAMKRQVMMIRRAVVPQRDMISSVNAGVVALPGFTTDGAIYFRSLYDHIIRIGDMVA